MISSVEAWNRMADVWTGLIWAVTWQSTVVVIVFAIVAAMLRRSSPALRYWLWQIAAIKLLLMPLWTVAILPPIGFRSDAGVAPNRGPEVSSSTRFVGRPESLLSAKRAEPEALESSVETTAPRISIRVFGWCTWILLIWVVGVVAQIVTIIRQCERLGRLLKKSIPVEDPILLNTVAEIAGRIGSKNAPRTFLVDGVGSPFVCGIRYPTLVLPRGLDRSLASMESFRAVLFHELNHLRRGDLILDWIPTIARVVYWFHPAAHYVAGQARLERELACDQAAMQLAERDASDYAAILVLVVSGMSEPHPA